MFKEPPGEMHIKYGYIIRAEYSVIKITATFSEHYKLNLPNYEGLMLIFSQKTGHLLRILLNKAHLTNIRTAAGGTATAN